MGSIASTNPGVADLLQTLTSASSPLASQLSQPAVQSALENAPPGDIVQLSNEALQLQEAAALLGEPSQTTSAIDASSILAALFPSSEPTVAGSASSASVADQVASYQSALQSDQVETLLGTAPTATSSSLVNLVG